MFASRPLSRAISAIGLTLAVGAVWWWQRDRAPEDLAPEPRWHNGVIVEIRHCEEPPGESAVLRCAALRCAQRVTQQLTNAQQTTLKLDRYVRDDQDGIIHINGTLDQELRAPTLPTGFSCDMRSLLDAKPTFVFGAIPGRSL